MDTSETYISQSDKARKYLPKHAWEDGDFIAIPEPRGYHIVTYHDAYFEEYMCGFTSDKSAIPLLRQDQLQAMVHPKDCTYAISYCLLDNFIRWYQSRYYDELARVYSMEQLWLAFVMKERYGKIWTGTEWITS